MPINLKQSYAEEFCNAIKDLFKKYPEGLFKLEGLHPDNLDINHTAKEFFKRRDEERTVSDKSIDGNSNIASNSAITFFYEVPKPLLKLNSIFNIWRLIREEYGVEKANEILEEEITGDIYINDAWDTGRSYSYHKDTSVIIKINGRIKMRSLSELFDIFGNQEVLEDREEINLLQREKDVQVYEEGKWVTLEKVIRHKSDNPLFAIATEKGNVFTVTSNHPCILSDGSEKKAEELELGDEILCHPRDVTNFSESVLVEDVSGILQWDEKTKRKYLAKRIDSSECSITESGTVLINGLNLKDSQVLSEVAASLSLKGVKSSIDPVYLDSLLRETKDEESVKPQRSCLYCVSFVPDKELISVSKFLSSNYTSIESTEYVEEEQKNTVLYKIELLPEREYVYDITTSSGRFYSNGNIVHNCFNYATYDLALKGLPVSGRLRIVPPKSFTSFLHQVEQFVVYAANMTLGATGLADLLIVASLYIDRMLEEGKDNHIHVARNSSREELEEDVWTYVKESFAHLIYTLNFEFRGNQSPFTNVSVYDKYFLQQLIPNYVLYNKTPRIETVQKTQEVFIDVMNEELERCPVTFPVTTACFSVKESDGERKLQDEEFLHFIAEKNLKNAFMNIYSGSTSTLSSCCRLRSSISDLGYSNTFGSGSTKIGSLGVVTINLPRIAKRTLDENGDFNLFLTKVKKKARTAGIINNAKRTFLKDRSDRGSLPLYTLGFMEFGKQYSTAGFTGLYEAMSILEYDMTDEEGVNHAGMTLDAINDENNLMSKEFSAPHNMEQVPAESSSIKLAKKDKLLGIFDDYPEWYVPFYSNQFLPLIKDGVDLIDRINVQGKLDQKCTGGAVCHLNVDNQIQDVDTMVNLIKYACEKGVVYFAVNYQLNECENGHMSVGRELENCPICESRIKERYTRVVGFLTSVKNWQKERRKYDFPNRKFYRRVSEELEKK